MMFPFAIFRRSLLIFFPIFPFVWHGLKPGRSMALELPCWSNALNRSCDWRNFVQESLCDKVPFSHLVHRSEGPVSDTSFWSSQLLSRECIDLSDKNFSQATYGIPKNTDELSCSGGNLWTSGKGRFNEVIIHFPEGTKPDSHLRQQHRSQLLVPSWIHTEHTDHDFTDPQFHVILHNMHCLIPSQPGYAGFSSMTWNYCMIDRFKEKLMGFWRKTS
jgi:hypothetical protein